MSDIDPDETPDTVTKEDLAESGATSTEGGEGTGTTHVTDPCCYRG